MLPLGFGRLDSKVSVQADAGGLPDSKEPADSVFEKFKSKRFSATDMWALLGECAASLSLRHGAASACCL